MYLTMDWPVDAVLDTETDDPVEFNAMPCEWEEPDLDEYLDASILLHGIKGYKVALKKIDGQPTCQVTFVVPDDFSIDNQMRLADEVAGGISDGFGENGLQAQGHNVYLELNLESAPKISTRPGPTTMPTLAVLAYSGSANALRAGIETARADNTLQSAMSSTFETMKPLSLAVGSGDIEKVQLLLDAGANPNGDGESDPLESTAIVNARCLPDAAAIEIAQCLIGAGAPAKNPKGLAEKALSRDKPKLAAYFETLEK